jgi:fumarate hydratase, class II
MMPGKTIPTQCEALAMVAGRSWAITLPRQSLARRATSSSTFQAFVIQNLLQSRGILTDSAISFARHMADNLAPNRDMLVTSLNPLIGYDKAVKIGKLALAENMTLKQAAERLGYVRPEDFDRWVVPATMTVPGSTLPGGGD